MDNYTVHCALCYYDLRNPIGIKDKEEIEDRNKKKEIATCSCDNCFYGRTKLAETILDALSKGYSF